MSNNGISRVEYFQKQFLRVQDFADEQVYHVAMRHRHNIAHHSWGIVRGLDIVNDPDGALFVQPGFAIDGYGRELILAARRRVDPTEFSHKGSVLNVFLVYSRQTSNPPPPGYAGCGNSGNGSDYRASESPTLRFEKPDPAFPNRRQPKFVPQTDLNFDATRTPVDDPALVWPVFLGQVTNTGSDSKPAYLINPADRPYAGLLGEGVTAPSGRARLQIGENQYFAQKDPFSGFGVFVPAMADQPALEVDSGGGISLRGDAQLQGNLTINNGALEFVVGTASAPQTRDQLNPEPQPWKIYLDSSAHELRIEMEKGAGGVTNEVAIGAFDSDQKKFVPCLTVDDQCNVTVSGDLIVQGQITGTSATGPTLVSAGLSQEAREFVLSGLLSGVSGSSILLDRFFKKPVLSATAQSMANALASDPALRATVADTLKANFSSQAVDLKNLL
jgi:hypothetical protein